MGKYLLIISMFITVGIGAQSLQTERARRFDNIVIKDSSVNKKWFISKYSGISASFVGFKGGSATMYAAPMGLQLNRMLTKNLYAFGGVEIAPAYVSFNQRFAQADFSKPGFANSFMTGNGNRFSINPSAYVGVGYMNDEKTFEIQARLKISQGNYFNNPADFRNFYNLDRQVIGFPK